MKVTKMLDSRSKRLGRPPLYTKAQRRTVAKYLRKYGLTNGLLHLAANEKFTVSVPTAMKIAASAKPTPIVFTRGRPVLV